MVNDFIRLDGPLPVGEEGLKIIPNLQELIRICREKSLPLVFANDALVPDDFMFQSRMKPHGIAGTDGVRIIDELETQPHDLIVPKRRLSAFFRTGLDITLKDWGIDTIVVGGVAAEICVLSTAYDGVSLSFRVIVLEDCCASRFKNIHENVISILKASPMYPLLKVMTLEEFKQNLTTIIPPGDS